MNFIRPNYLVPWRRFSLNRQSLVQLDIDDKSGIATLTMNRQPVNSLNIDIFSDMSQALTEIENNKSRGMILASASKSCFSSGLDITEMYKPDQERFKKFWWIFQEVCRKLFSSPYPVVAAINGHAPAGGCVLALCCEYRIMCKGYNIGLNESKVGIVAPFWIMGLMKNVIGKRRAELALTTSTLYTTAEAFNIGLIDEMVEDKTELLQKSIQFLNRFKDIPQDSRSLTKHAFRAKFIDKFDKERAKDMVDFIAATCNPLPQQNLGKYLDNLREKKQR